MERIARFYDSYRSQHVHGLTLLTQAARNYLPLVMDVWNFSNRRGWTASVVSGWHRRMVHSRRVRVLAMHLSELIPAGHSVLDVGCGDGLVDSLILERRPDLKITGVEVLVRARRKVPVTLFDGKRLPFPNGSGDTVVFCDVLHHTERPVALLHEAIRVALRSVVIRDHVVEGVLDGRRSAS